MTQPGTQPGQNQFDEPPEEALPDERAEISFFAPDEAAKRAGASKAEKARRKHEGKLLEIDGVEGVSLDSGDLGEDIVMVFVRDESVVKKIPKTLDGVPVRVEVTGEFDAFLDDLDEIESRAPSAPKRKVKPKRKTAGKSPASKAKPGSKAKTGAKRKAASLMDTSGKTPEKPTEKPTEKPKVPKPR